MKVDQNSREKCIGIACTAIFTLYIFCMVLIPTFSNWNQQNTWREVQNVWDRWQTFNSSMIALIASAIAIYSTIYKDQAERKRNFSASLAFLPHALSELDKYLGECAKVYINILDAIGNSDDANFHYISDLNIAISVPKIQPESLHALTECIKYADSIEGTHLARILTDLQVVNARLVNLPDQEKYLTVSNPGVISELENLARIDHRIRKTFSFARSEGELNYIEPTASEIKLICRMVFNLHDMYPLD